MILFSITIPTDKDYLVRLVRDFFALIRKAYPEVQIKTADITFGEDDNGNS